MHQADSPQGIINCLVVPLAFNGDACQAVERDRGFIIELQRLPESGLGPILSRLTAACAAADMTFVWYTPTQYCRFNPLTMDLGVKQCTAAKYNMCVEPNGDVLPCQSYYQPLGNILKDEWNAIYNNELAREIRERGYAPPRCRECPDLEICGAGCPLSVKYEKVFCCPDAASSPA